MNNGMYSATPSGGFANKTKLVNDLAESKLTMLQRGSVTEITLGGRTFQISDPKKIEHAISILKHQEEAISNLRVKIKEHSTAIGQLVREIQNLKNEVQRLKEITNGYGSQEFNG